MKQNRPITAKDCQLPKELTETWTTFRDMTLNPLLDNMNKRLEHKAQTRDNLGTMPKPQTRNNLQGE